ncbi:unnamed protein product [Hapterophycus canaliculatus]
MYGMKIGCAALAFVSKASGFVPAALGRNSLGTGSVQSVSSTALRMVSVGQAAPDFKLNDQNGKPVSLSSFKNKKKVVVFFYPKDSTPGCTKEACTFQSDLSKFKQAGAEVIGVSSDADHSSFVAENNLSMTLLSDIGGKVRKEWKVKGAVFGTIVGRVTYVLDKKGVVVSMYDNLLDGAAHSKEALKAVTA